MTRDPLVIMMTHRQCSAAHWLALVTLATTGSPVAVTVQCGALSESHWQTAAAAPPGPGPGAVINSWQRQTPAGIP